MEASNEVVYQPSGRGPEILVLYSFFAGFTTIVMALRMYVRTFMVKSVGIDDYAMLFGWAMFIAFMYFGIAGTYHGTGQHMELIIPAWNIPIALKDWWMCEPIYVISNMAVKLSICLMLLRIVVDKIHRWIIFVVLAVIEVYSVVFFFLFVFQCIPSKFFWTRFAGDTDGRCMDPSVAVNATYIYSAISCAADWILALLPWFLVRKLNMSQRTKYMVACVLALGSIASTATIVRIPYVHQLGNVADFLYATTDVAIWSCIETGLAITASSAATLKPLVKKILDYGKSGKFGSSGYNSRSKSMPLTADKWPGNNNARRSYIRTDSRTDTFGESERFGKDANIMRTFEVSVSRE